MPLLDAARRAVRGLITAAAHDRTATAAVGSALVLAPHPDDETLGCGATILRKRAAGTPVVVAVATDGRHSHTSRTLSPQALADLRAGELAEAAVRLGLEPHGLVGLGFEDGTLAEREPELLAAVSELIARVHPDQVYVTSAREPHSDHAALSRAARRACAVFGVELLEYPVWLWRTWPLAAGARWATTWEALQIARSRGAITIRTGGFGAGKLHALAAHASQLDRPAGVPEDEPWPRLPAPVLDAAAAPVELFFPVRLPPA